VETIFTLNRFFEVMLDPTTIFKMTSELLQDLEIQFLNANYSNRFIKTP